MPFRGGNKQYVKDLSTKKRYIRESKGGKTWRKKEWKIIRNKLWWELREYWKHCRDWKRYKKWPEDEWQKIRMENNIEKKKGKI